MSQTGIHTGRILNGEKPSSSSTCKQQRHRERSFMVQPRQDLSPSGKMTRTVKRKRKRAASQGSLEFEWPVPDVSMIGGHLPGKPSVADRATIDRTLPREVDRDVLWAHLEPAIKETREPKEIVKALTTTIRALDISTQTLTQLRDDASARHIEALVTRLQDALRYYETLSQRREARLRLKMFSILRAWLEAGGKMTISSPDNPDREKRERRGRGTPTGPLIKYFLTSCRIICGEGRTPEGAKAFFYRIYKKHLHFQQGHAELRASSTLAGDAIVLKGRGKSKNK